MATIELTKGKTATVDKSAMRELDQYLWRAVKRMNSWYAVRVEELQVQGGRRRRRAVFMHRHLMQVDPGILVDHKNGDGLDNRRRNLRACTHAQNTQNARKFKRGSSAYKGVSWHTPAGKWQAQIQVDKKKMCLGYFDNEVLAAKTYDRAASKHFGEFAALNFPRSVRGQCR
jgi:hypothetical protein